VEGDGAAALGAAARDLSRAPVRDHRARPISRRTSSTASSSARRRIFPPCNVSPGRWSSSTRNRDADNWLLQIETFDPHEPFFAPERFKAPFDTGWNGPVRDWPRYGRVDELPEECEELRANYYAMVSMCDFLLGQLLDYFDRHDHVEGHRAGVTTDHGFLLGEHDFWAKNRMNLYQEVGHIPLFMHDPRRPTPGERRAADADGRSRADLPRSVRRRAAARDRGRFAAAADRARPRAARGRLFGYFGGASTSPTGATPITAIRRPEGRRKSTSTR
jgi:hypothetical protein